MEVNIIIKLNNFLLNFYIFICLGLLTLICDLSYYIWYRNVLLPNKKDFMFINDIECSKHKNHLYTKHTYYINWIGGIINGVLIVFLIYVDCYTDADFSGWISGIGSMSAVIVALYSIVRKDQPKIKLVHIFNPANQSLTIQALNESDVSDFIKLDNITASCGTFNKKIIVKSNVNKNYYLYNKLPAKGICTFDIFHNVTTSDEIVGAFTYSSSLMNWLMDEYNKEKQYEDETKSGKIQLHHGYGQVLFEFSDTCGTPNLCERVNISEFK